MIPLFAVIRIARGSGKGFRLWLPLFLVWLVLAPVVLLLLPIAFVACLIARINPFKAAVAIWTCLTALRGMHVEVDNRVKSVFIHIY